MNEQRKEEISDAVAFGPAEVSGALMSPKTLLLRGGESSNHSFKSLAIAAVIARYSLLRQGTAIYVHVQFSRYISL